MEIQANDAKNNEKIGKVLQKFLEPNFKIRNDVYLNLFLTHLIGKEEADKTARYLRNQHLKEQFFEWIIRATTLWRQENVNPQATILSFALNLCSQLSADEQIFIKLNCQDIYESLVDVAGTNSTKEPAVTLGLVTLLCSFLGHKSGLQWVLSTTHWTGVIDLGLKAHTTYIRKKACQFVIRLLEKTISFNRNFGACVVGLLIKPLRDALRNLPSDGNSQHTEVENGELHESLRPTLDFILGVIEPLLRNLTSKVLELFFEQQANDVIDKLILLSRGEEFSFQLLQIQFVFLFYEMSLRTDGLKVVNHNSPTVFHCRLMFDLIKNEMDKGHVRGVIKICDYAHGLFYDLAPRLPTLVSQGHRVECHIQMMFLQMTPILSLSYQLMREQKLTSLLLNDVFRINFCRRWLKLGAVHSIEITYRWIENLKMKPDLADDVVFCMQYVSKMKRLLDKERAAIIFPALVYSLGDALAAMKEIPSPGGFTTGCTLYLKTVMDTIIDLVETFDLTWKDSVETLCVMEYAYDILQYPNWNDKMMIIKGLKLLNTSITKYMSPDMVLLIYHKEDSKISQTGSLLYAKCHDSSWEIRDSALEVVCTLSLNANTKFPAYTNILLNAKLPRLVVCMAFKDGENYVRATAFKCLQELIQISEIWDEILQIDNVLDDLLKVFENETEGVVRKEATTLIFKIDKFQSFPEDILPRLYDVMTHAAIGDLHWEVKCNALDFWFNISEQRLIDQGMIDRMFPSHTFSKELKKIVALNEEEVKKRIIKVLNQLAEIGCLHVMKCAVQDDCDIEVSKKATSFTFTLLRMFKGYKISCENVDQSQPLRAIILQNIVLSRPLTESITPGRAPYVPSPDSIGDLIPDLPFSDLCSPIARYNPSLDFDVVTLHESTNSDSPSSQNTGSSPLPDEPSYGNSTKQQGPPISTTQSHTVVSNSSTNQQISDLFDLYNPFLDHSVVTLPGSTNSDSSGSPIPQSCSPQGQSPNGNSIHQQVSPISVTESRTSVSNSPSNQVRTSVNPTKDAAQFEDAVGPSTFVPVRADHMLEEFLNSSDVTLHQEIYNPTERVNSSSLDASRREQMLEEFLDSNDVTLLQQIYNPTDQVNNNTTQLKTKTYLAPSQYLKFVYNEVETLAVGKTQWLNSLDEFGSLLDDILREYSIGADVNSMDCY